jgi:hypothetical protein
LDLGNSLAFSLAPEKASIARDPERNHIFHFPYGASEMTIFAQVLKIVGILWRNVVCSFIVSLPKPCADSFYEYSTQDPHIG